MAQTQQTIPAWDYYRFTNNTGSVQQVTGLYFNRDFSAPRTVTLQPNETADAVPFDGRFWDLLIGNYALKGLGLAPIFAVGGCSIDPFPVASAPAFIRLTFASPLPAAQADILRGFTAGGVNMLVTMCESPQYAGPQILTSVQGAPGNPAAWIEFSADDNILNQSDLRNGSIQAAFGLPPALNGQFQVGVAVRAFPFRDPAVPFNNSLLQELPASNPDTWQYIGEMNAPRHSGVGALLSTGNVLYSHGSESPYSEAFASNTWCVVNPVSGAIENFGDNNVNGTVVAGYDRGFTHKSIRCADGKHRVYVAGGFSSNDEILNENPCVEAFTEENNSWDGATALHFQLIQTVVGVRGPYAFGANYMNTYFPLGPTLPPLKGTVAAPGDGTAGKILQPSAVYGGGGPFGVPPGQYSFSTAAVGVLPNTGFDFGQLFADSLVQLPNTVGPPPPGVPFDLGPFGSFCVDATNGDFYFSPSVFSAAKQVMATTPYWLKPVSATAPGPIGRVPGVGASIRGFICAMDPLPDGRIPIVGGFGSNAHPGFLYNEVQTTISMIDPTTGECTDVGNLLVAVGNEPHNAVVHPNGKIYVFGGFLTTFFPGPVSASGFTQIYDPATNICTLGATNPFAASLGPTGGYARTCNPVVLPDGGILIAGGTYVVGSIPSGNVPPTARSFVYYPDTDIWVEVSPMKVAICAGWSYLDASGMVLQVGGAQHGNIQSDRQLTTSIQQFDYRTGAWARLRDLPPQVGGHWYRGVLTPNKKIVFGGGIGSVSRNSLIGQPMTSVNAYSPA